METSQIHDDASAPGMDRLFHPATEDLPPPLPSRPLLPPPAYTPLPTQPVHDGVTILLRCPHLSSCSWCLRLYCTVCGGMGAILSTLWVCGHCYVLTHTVEGSLRTQR